MSSRVRTEIYSVEIRVTDTVRVRFRVRIRVRVRVRVRVRDRIRVRVRSTKRYLESRDFLFTCIFKARNPLP